MDVARETEQGHGRIEHRRLESTDLLRGYLDWPGVEQVCRIERRRIIAGKESREVVYAITSLSRERAGAEALLRLSRGHWGIENRLHWVRDVTLREDACRVRSRKGAQGLAAVRNTALTLLRRMGFTNIVEGLEHFMEHRAHAVRLLRYGRIK